MDLWSVLGIDPTQDAAELKRAYARQVKIHSPEADPEGFQKLRHAYETLLAKLRSPEPRGPRQEREVALERSSEPEAESESESETESESESESEIRSRGVWPRADELARGARGERPAKPEIASPAQQAETLARDVFAALVEQGEEAALAELRDRLRSSQSLEVEDHLVALVASEIQRFNATFWPAEFVAGVSEILELKQRAIKSPGLVDFLDYCRVRNDWAKRTPADRCRREIGRLIQIFESEGEEASARFLDGLVAAYHTHADYRKVFEICLIEAIPRLSLGRWPRTVMARIAQVLCFDGPQPLPADRAPWSDFFRERLRTSLLREKLEQTAGGGDTADAIAARLLLLPPENVVEYLPLPPGPIREAVRARLLEIELDHPRFWTTEGKPAERRPHLERIARHVRHLTPSESAVVRASALRGLRWIAAGLGLFCAVWFGGMLLGDTPPYLVARSMLGAAPYLGIALAVAVAEAASHWFLLVHVAPRLRLLGRIAATEGVDKVIRPLTLELSFGERARIGAPRGSLLGMGGGALLLAIAAVLAFSLESDGHPRDETALYSSPFATSGLLLLSVAFFKWTPRHAAKRFRMGLHLGPLFVALLPAGLGVGLYYWLFGHSDAMASLFVFGLAVGGVICFGLSVLLAASSWAPRCRCCRRSLRGRAGLFPGDARDRLAAALAARDLDAVIAELKTSLGREDTMQIVFAYCDRCADAVWARGPRIDVVVEGDRVSRLIEALRR
jgi:hypothetical protein